MSDIDRIQSVCNAEGSRVVHWSQRARTTLPYPEGASGFAFLKWRKGHCYRASRHSVSCVQALFHPKVISSRRCDVSFLSLNPITRIAHPHRTSCHNEPRGSDEDGHSAYAADEPRAARSVGDGALPWGASVDEISFVLVPPARRFGTS